MKRAVVFVTLVAALGTACKKAPEKPDPAAPPNGVVTTDPVPAALSRPLFWAVEKDGKTTHFLGTMHAGVEARALPALVWRTLHAARAFAMEANLDDPDVATLVQPTASSLREALGEDYWKKLEDAMGAGVAGAIEHRPPLVPAAALAMRGLPATAAMDKVLSAFAASERKPIVFLEPATRQLAILRKWLDVKALKMMLDDLPGGERRAREMLDAYLAGDERAIIAIGDRERASALRHGYTAAEYDQQMDEMLYQRNAAWLDAIEQLHAEGDAFVAVGALHLLGPRSVLELLAQRGYRVARVAP